VFLADLAALCLRAGSQRQTKQRRSVEVMARTGAQVTAKHIVERLELVAETTQLPTMFTRVQL